MWGLLDKADEFQRARQSLHRYKRFYLIKNRHNNIVCVHVCVCLYTDIHIFAISMSIFRVK